MRTLKPTRLLSLDAFSSSHICACAGRRSERHNDCSGWPEPSIPVGMPIADTAVFLVPRQQRDSGGAELNAAQTVCCEGLQVIVEHGALGEVCIAGACVAAGYLG